MAEKTNSPDLTVAGSLLNIRMNIKKITEDCGIDKKAVDVIPDMSERVIRQATELAVAVIDKALEMEISRLSK